MRTRLRRTRRDASDVSYSGAGFKNDHHGAVSNADLSAPLPLGSMLGGTCQVSEPRKCAFIYLAEPTRSPCTAGNIDVRGAGGAAMRRLAPCAFIYLAPVETTGVRGCNRAEGCSVCVYGGLLGVRFFGMGSMQHGAD